MIKFQIARFGIIGGISTVIHGSVALISASYLNATLVYANLLGYLSAVAFSFFGHSLWVFRQQPSMTRLIKYLTINSIILIIIVSTSALLDYFHIKRVIGIIIVTLLIPGASYFIHKQITFNNRCTLNE